MGIEKFPNRRMYWNPVTLSKVISESNMTRNRFDELLRVLHFNNNAFQKNPGEVGCNCLFKLQPIIDHFRHVFSTSVIPETMLAVDEMMVAFKGRQKYGGIKFDPLLVFEVMFTILRKLASMIEKELLLVRNQLKV